MPGGIRLSAKAAFRIPGLCLAFLARQEGFEPPAYCLEGSCSIQLSYWRIGDPFTGDCPVPKNPSKKGLERVMGIEPTCSAWKADILPLNYTRGFF